MVLTSCGLERLPIYPTQLRILSILNEFLLRVLVFFFRTQRKDRMSKAHFGFPVNPQENEAVLLLRYQRTLERSRQFLQLLQSPLTKHSSSHGNHCTVLYGGHRSTLQIPPAPDTGSLLFPACFDSSVSSIYQATSHQKSLGRRSKIEHQSPYPCRIDSKCTSWFCVNLI